jgi:hypothetical protein
MNISQPAFKGKWLEVNPIKEAHTFSHISPKA